MKGSSYIVAVRRERRADAPADWVQQVAALDGVSLIGASDRRAQVSADDHGIQLLRDSLGVYMHIEPVIEHRSR